MVFYIRWRKNWGNRHTYPHEIQSIHKRNQEGHCKWRITCTHQGWMPLIFKRQNRGKSIVIWVFFIFVFVYHLYLKSSTMALRAVWSSWSFGCICVCICLYLYTIFYRICLKCSKMTLRAEWSSWSMWVSAEESKKGGRRSQVKLLRKPCIGFYLPTIFHKENCIFWQTRKSWVYVIILHFFSGKIRWRSQHGLSRHWLDAGNGVSDKQLPKKMLRMGMSS